MNKYLLDHPVFIFYFKNNLLSYFSSTVELYADHQLEDYTIPLLINRIVYRGYFLFLILAGTCGNLLTAITLLQAKLRKYTTCQFMAVCALLNIGVLLTHTSNMMLTQGHDFHLRSLYDVGWCRINVFIAQWIRGMASWILVIIAFDRFRQSKTIRRVQPNKNRTVLITMIILSLILVILNLHYLLFAGIRVKLDGRLPFIACSFLKQESDPIHTFFATANTWHELVAITIIVSLIIKNKEKLYFDILAMYININIKYIYYKKFIS